MPGKPGNRVLPVASIYPDTATRFDERTSRDQPNQIDVRYITLEPLDPDAHKPSQLLLSRLDTSSILLYP